MNDWFVDANVLAKWIPSGPDSAQALKVVSDTTAAGGRLFALDIAKVEAANAVWSRHHRRLISTSEAKRALVLLENAAVQIVPSLPTLSSAFDIAIQFDLAVYDALFVAAADSAGVGGVTADEPLVRAISSVYPQIKLLRSW